MTSFLSPPLEVRSMVYGYLTPAEGRPICPWQEFKKKIHFNLLRTNQIIYQEYRSLLYSDIPFRLETWAVELLAKWFDQIGQQNARLIREIYILFPRVHTKTHSDDPAPVIDERHAQILDKVQSLCTGLKVLVINLPNSIMQLQEMADMEAQEPGYITDAVALVNKRLTEIPYLERIEAEFPSHVERTEITHEMQRHGWTIEDVEAEWLGGSTEKDRRSDSEALREEAEAGLYDLEGDSRGDAVMDDMANWPDYIIGGG
ncbi:hypothetical protein DPV78_003607 [Talaromyces pinophilus]|nr:hypothetical protein DPV78_003607 [Talaromyces pinophilus]